MIRNPPEIPPDVASRFVDAMRAFFKEEDPSKRDAIAAHQLDVLRRFQGAGDEKMRLSDVKAMFFEMKKIAG